MNGPGSDKNKIAGLDKVELSVVLDKGGNGWVNLEQAAKRSVLTKGR